MTPKTPVERRLRKLMQRADADNQGETAEQRERFRRATDAFFAALDADAARATDPMTPQTDLTALAMERYAEVSRHELHGPRADGFLAYVFRRFEQQHPPPFGDGGNLIMLWRRDFAPPPAVAPAALVALVVEYQQSEEQWDGSGAAAKRTSDALSALRRWTPDAAAPPVAAPAVEHRCGVQGFNHMLGDVCPACAARYITKKET